jgi:hypothetical protein
MSWINSRSILVNVCGVASASMFVHLMPCSGQTHRCPPVKAEANLFMELKLLLLRFRVRVEAMAHRRHRLMSHQAAEERND